MKSMRIKPINMKLIRPTTLISFKNTNTLGNSKKSRVLPDAGNQPDPTPEKIRNYKENKDQWIPQIVTSSLRKHNKTDVLHGGKSLNMLLPSHRDSDDWDMYTTEDKKRALELEAAIDKKAGCDIAETVYVPLQKSILMGPAGDDDEFISDDLYRVQTPIVKKDADIDIMERPPGLPTVMKNGIRHEALSEAYKKAKRRVYKQPLQARKAVEDMKRIEEYRRRTR